MVANGGCVTPRNVLNTVDFSTIPTPKSGSNAMSAIHQQSTNRLQNKETLLYNRSRSGGLAKRNKQPDEADWGVRPQRPKTPSTPTMSNTRAQSNGRARTPNRLIQHHIDNPPRSAEGGPLAKLTPTERLRSFENGNKRISINRTITPQRSRQMEGSKIIASPRTPGGSRTTTTTTTTISRPQSRGKSRPLDSRLLVTEESPPMTDVTRRHENQHHSHPRETTIFQSARSPSYPSSPRPRSPRDTTRNTRRPSNKHQHQPHQHHQTTLFQHARKEQIQKEQQRQRHQREAAVRQEILDEDESDHGTMTNFLDMYDHRNPHSTKRQSMKPSLQKEDTWSDPRFSAGRKGHAVLNPMERFRDPYKNPPSTTEPNTEATETPTAEKPKMKTVTNWGIAEIVSDLSCSSAGLSNLVKGNTEKKHTPLSVATQRLQQAIADARNQIYPPTPADANGDTPPIREENRPLPKEHQKDTIGISPNEKPQSKRTARHPTSNPPPTELPEPPSATTTRDDRQPTVAAPDLESGYARKSRSKSPDPLREVGISSTGVEYQRRQRQHENLSASRLEGKNSAGRPRSPTPDRLLRPNSVDISQKRGTTPTPQKRSTTPLRDRLLKDNASAATSEIPIPGDAPSYKRPITPTFPFTRSRSQTPTQERQRAAFSSSASIGSQTRERPRSVTPNRLLPSLRTPGQILGDTRHFVDKAEERLMAIQRKREAEERLVANHHQGNRKMEKNLGLESQRGGASSSFDGPSTRTHTKGKKESTVKRFFGTLGGKGDKKLRRVNSSGDLGNATTATLGMLRGGGTASRGLGVGPAGSSTLGLGGTSPRMAMPVVATSVEESVQHSPRQSLSKRWFGRRRDEVPSRATFEVHNGSTASSRLAPPGQVILHDQYGREGSYASTRTGELEYAQEKSSVDSSSRDASNMSDKMLKQMTTFDSLMKAIEDDKKLQAPEAEFAVVELGDEENTIQAHSVLVNPASTKGHVTSSQDHHGNGSTKYKTDSVSRRRLMQVAARADSHSNMGHDDATTNSYGNGLALRTGRQQKIQHRVSRG